MQRCAHRVLPRVAGQEVNSYLDWILTTPTHSMVVEEIMNPPEGRRPWSVPHITCADGATISVQANETAYCDPRNCDGPWTHVEVAIRPAQKESIPRSDRAEWAKYHDSNGIYGYVPVYLVRSFIELHGGEDHDANEAALAHWFLQEGWR